MNTKAQQKKDAKPKVMFSDNNTGELPTILLQSQNNKQN